MTGLSSGGRTYGSLTLDRGAWLVGELEPHVAIKIKAVFPQLPKASRGPFRLGRDAQAAADLAWFTSRYPLRMSDDAAQALADGKRQFESTQAEVGRIMALDYTPPLFDLLQPGQQVRTHQARSAELLAMFGGLLVADDVGEGKTYTGGACMMLPGALPATVVCPTHLRLQWAQKLGEFTTLSTHVVATTVPHALPPVDVRIFSYSNLAGWIDYLGVLGTGLAVFDEAHALRNGEATAKGSAARALIDCSRMRLALTGTPIFNYGDELWRLMSFIRPEVLGEWEDFVREWCASGFVVRDPAALNSYMVEQHAMVRKRGAALEPNTIIQVIDHDVRQLDSVQALAHQLAVTAKTGTFHERGEAVRKLDMLLRHETGVAKARSVAAYVRVFAEAGEPVVLFGWHRDVYDIWLEELADLNPVLYTGSETPLQKNAAKAEFVSGRARVMIISLRSGEGLDGLQQVCKVAVIGELDWSPAVHKQNVGRINREGQTCWPEPVTLVYLIADDGSDPEMVEVLGLKASQAHGVVDGTLAIPPRPSDMSAIERLVERYFAKSPKPKGEAA